MRTLAPTLLTFFGLALVDLPAQYIADMSPKTPAATTVKATLAVPHNKVLVASPIRLELTMTTTGPWNGWPRVCWERRDAKTGTWQAFVDKSPVDVHSTVIAAATTVGWQMGPKPHVLWHLTPGTWRAKVQLGWSDVDDQPHSEETAWCEIEIADHAANQAAMRDTSHGIISPWQWVLSGSRLTEGLVVPAELQGKGLLPKGTPMADMAAAITTMRNSGVSNELALAADLVLLCREVRQVCSLAAGPARVAAAKAPIARLEALAKANPMTPTPLGGRYGDVMQVLLPLLRLDDPMKAAQIVDRVRLTTPLLADRIALDLVIW